MSQLCGQGESPGTRTGLVSSTQAIGPGYTRGSLLGVTDSNGQRQSGNQYSGEPDEQRILMSEESGTNSPTRKTGYVIVSRI